MPWSQWPQSLLLANPVSGDGHFIRQFYGADGESNNTNTPSTGAEKEHLTGMRLISATRLATFPG